MLGQVCNLISRIVFLGVNGTICIPILILLIWYLAGQAIDFIPVAREILSNKEV